jgi:hypothetical protein
MTHYTLGTAANACGLNKSTVQRAIKAGKISATRDEHGQWQIDPAEMHRVYPLVASNPEEQRSEQRYAPVQHRDRTDELVAELRARLDDIRNERDHARTDANTWRAAFERELAQRALPTPGNVAQAPEATAATPDWEPRKRSVPLVSQPNAQPSRLRRAWRWMRATGCLAGAGLLLALSTVPAGAQQQQPQQQPPPGCFTVEMSHSTQGNPQGSILLDRCTGKTWLLLCIRNDTAGCAFRWAPIPDATEPAGGP